MAENNIIEKSISYGKYDESNPLVIIHKNKSEKKKSNEATKMRILSRSKRKLLQKQVAKKQKKLSRNDLWKELEQFAGNTISDISVDKLFSRNRRTEKKLDKISKSSAPKSKIWCEKSSSSESSIDTDEFSSTEETTEHDEEKEEIKKDTVENIQMECEEVKPKLEHTTAKMNYVLINRLPDIQTARMSLPIVAEEASIMEKIAEYDAVIICGATGCGKTTQLPQFLYEAGYTRDGYKIGITEPRRVAAISMSERVSEELNLKDGQVAYHIRYEKNSSSRTEIKFMTDGILLQEIKKDFELSRYSAIVIDEAHERSIYTDVLLGLLSLIVRLRRRKYESGVILSEADKCDKRLLPLPLKLIIMSATLRVDDFANNRQLFPTLKSAQQQTQKVEGEDETEHETVRPGAPPVIRIESRQFPVTCHFSRFTPDDYLKAAFRKVVSIHKESPPGGILVFVTGQREVKTMCNWLSKCFPMSTNTTCTADNSDAHCGVETGPNDATSAAEPSGESSKKKGRRAIQKIEKEEQEEIIQNEEKKEVNHETLEAPSSRFNLDNFDIIPADEESELGLLNNSSAKALNTKRDAEDEEEDDEDAIDAEVLNELEYNQDAVPLTQPICALPLYSLLPQEQQKRVFEPPPWGCRQVVVATNVAETSLTIPNVRFVVDTGKVKSKIYDSANGASCFKIVWVSQASSEQRAGRAGRIGPGHCYRLYSSRIFTDMEPFCAPDILTRPIDEVVLLLKSYLGSTPLVRFPLPTPPSMPAVEAAERRLRALGALDEKKHGSEVTRMITRAGRWMARLPLPTRFARMLLFANQRELMPYAVVLVAALSVPDFFIPEPTTLDDEPAIQTTTTTGKKRKRGEKTAAEKLADHRVNFLRQFVNTQADLLLGDLAVLLGSVCCFERYWGQLIGLLPRSDWSTSQSGISIDRINRLNPEATMRQLVTKCGVRWKAYTEVRQLRRQLTDILNANVPGLDLRVDLGLPKPSPTQVEVLRQLFLVGSACHVATKFDLPSEGLPIKDKRRLRYAYKVPGVSEPAFIDPASPLARENCSFIAYAELHTSSKPLLRYVCAISPEWIPFLTPHSYRVEGITVMDSKTDDDISTEKKNEVTLKEGKDCNLDDDDDDDDNKHRKITAAKHETTPDTPHYDAEQDVVLAYGKRVYFIGADLISINSKANIDMEYSFELPAHMVPVPLSGSPAAECLGAHESLVWSVRWFARSLLEGVVFPQLVDWFPKHLKTSTPTRMITLSWGLVRTEVRNLISKLLTKKIASRAALEACLLEDPEFIRGELIVWLQAEHVSSFQAKWPPVKVDL